MSQIKRTFIPGDEWLYFKLYTGIKTADSILTNSIDPIMRRLKRENWIHGFFFIRYSDPEFHLRLRLHISEPQYLGEVLNYFNSKIKKNIKQALIHKIDISTYNRELERYNYSDILILEKIFGTESEVIISILNILKKKSDLYRWKAGFLLVDEILTMAGHNLIGKANLMTRLSDAFKTEFGFNEYNQKQLNSKFRDNRKMIEVCLNKCDLQSDDILSHICQYINNYRKKTTPLFNQLKRDRNIVEDSILSSIIHMMMNRLFRAKNRICELIMYDFIRRFYESEISKQTYNRDKTLAKQSI